MKTLVYGMQSSGASFVTFCLAQKPNTIAVIDLFCREEAPRLDEEADGRGVILKCVVNTVVPLKTQVERFRPDRLLLVTRNVDDVAASLGAKPYRDLGGPMKQKLDIYQDVLLRRLHLFDTVISYERFAADPPEIHRSRQEIVNFNATHSPWCRKYFGRKWGFGGLRSTERPRPQSDQTEEAAS